MGSGMLGLELPLHQQQNPQNPHHLQHPQIVAYTHHESDHHQHSQQSAKHAYPFASTKPKQLLSPLSNEDEPSFTGDDSTTDGKRKISPWQRMKWTDNMVRLLIMAVFYIGDEVGSEVSDPIGKKKPGGLAQKKGKWKSVSRAMMEKGFYVSPQQCEDKFNDLNKRYKRVNDILGKGTACRVVENQSLLDTMDLSPKMKDEVRKLLNSKHLFFREMCAYHNSCGHAPSGVASGISNSPEMAADPSHAQHQQATQQQQQYQRCSHSTENTQVVTNSMTETEGSKMAKLARNEEDDHDESEEDEDDYAEDEEEEDDDDERDDDEEDYEENEDEAVEGNSRHQNGHGHGDEDDRDEKSSRKRPRKEVFSTTSSLMQQLNGEITNVLRDGAKSSWEKNQWMKLKLVQLEEQQVNYQCQAFELEKQRLKWVKFSSKKEREMERAKLENERRRLENERMVLIVRKKELELLDTTHQQQQLPSNKRSDPSSIAG
ncbi:PREDICTED: 46 kDa FK506-binding nuclear protein-like [Populus euphratica]|uniref:46 kDa FK506-binding nuclear protein-like n=1 Tax=Populus euphratica TaxID=75702 RepID=A0AAJ6XHL7_POPEU|nr:PREDICTED: 46 kDa FK506-binding nuclear protein-like [Populus euphratica]